MNFSQQSTQRLLIRSQRSEKDEGATGIGATGLRGSEWFWGLEGVSDSDSVRGHPGTSERTPWDWRTGHRMYLSEVSGHPHRAPLRVTFSSQSCGSCCPLKLLQKGVRGCKHVPTPHCGSNSQQNAFRWKNRFSYLCRLEGIFRIFSA